MGKTIRITRGGSKDEQYSVAKNWYAGWKAKCMASGFESGLTFIEFCSQLRAEGAMSMLGYINKDDESKLSYDPRAELITDLRARLGIADAWLRGELDPRPSPEAIATYQRFDYDLPELPAAEDEADTG
jgi:hypothetical protein